VIATQNPSSQIGTFPLPESQLDRFLLRIELGYPDHDAERSLLESGGRREQLPTLPPASAPASSPAATTGGGGPRSPALLDYLQLLVEATRKEPALRAWPESARRLVTASPLHAPGHSPAAAQMVLPEDVQAVLPAVARHRCGWSAAAMPTPKISPLLIRSVPLA
jgi:MoxR-like ATPase